MSNEQVFADIKVHVVQCGGIAADARDPLFNGHRVGGMGDSWIYRACASDQDARIVENALLRLGLKGGPCGGDGATKSACKSPRAPWSERGINSNQAMQGEYPI